MSANGSSAQVETAAGVFNRAEVTLGSADFDVAARVSFSSLSAGARKSVSLVGRSSADERYIAALGLAQNGRLELRIDRVTAVGTTQLGAGAMVVKAYKAGVVYVLRFQGAASTLRAKAWSDGSPEPSSFQVVRTDATPIATGVGVGIGASADPGYTGGGSASVDDFRAVDPANASPESDCADGSAEFSGLTPGTHVFTVRASASKQERAAIYPWRIDPPPPTVSISAGPGPNTTSRSAEFTVELGGGAVDTVNCLLDGEPYPNGDGDCLSTDETVSLDAIALGEHTFEVTASNVSGTASDSWSWVVYQSILPLIVTVEPSPAEDVDDPPVLLKVAGSIGSQSLAVDCDSGVNFRDEIVGGCRTPYRISETLDCSAYSTANLPPSSFTPDPVPDCMITEVGDVTGSFRDGLHERYESPCTPNNWSSFPNLPADDPRIVYLPVTPEPSLSGSGNPILPVIGIARFYVTGWDYHPTQSPGCPANDPHPVLGSSYSHTLDNGDIWGHFVP